MSQGLSPFSSRSLYYGWLPTYPEVHRAFLEKHIAGTINGTNLPEIPWVTKFINAFKGNPLTPLLFEEVDKETKWEASDERFRVQNIQHLKDALNSVLQTPPEVLVVERKVMTFEGYTVQIPIGEPIGVPIYLVLDLLSNTSAGYDLFRTEQFNNAAKELLEDWNKYLKSTGEWPHPPPSVRSNSTLNTKSNGWFGDFGLKILEKGLQGMTFKQTYGVDPTKPDPYPSWDAFFTRHFQNIESQRPVIPFRDGKLTAIYNACESTSFRTAHNVQRNDTFWLKGQTYSIWDMLGRHQADIKPTGNYADLLAGGSVYQAFLSPQDYHHWHSPTSGKVVAAYVVPGTYYATLPDGGAGPDDQDYKEGDPHGALIRSQPWLSISAARGVFIIKPDDNLDLEWAAVIGIGMVEVSTIDILPKFRDAAKSPVPVAAGEELGMFHFGGSTHVLILKAKPGKHVVFKDIYDIEITPGQHRWVRSIIGRVEETQNYIL